MTKTSAKFGLTPPSPPYTPHQITTMGLTLPTSMIDNFPTFLNLHAAMQDVDASRPKLGIPKQAKVKTLQRLNAQDMEGLAMFNHQTKIRLHAHLIGIYRRRFSLNWQRLDYIDSRE